MNLEQVAAVIRPRRANEAVDLGFALARRFWLPTWGSFLLVFAPFYWGLWLLLGENWWGFIPVIVWWTKPVIDKAPLYVLSRALFGATPSIPQTVRSLPKLLWHNMGWGLTLQRLDPRRSLRLPVYELEGLKGRARGRRLSLIDRRVQGTAVMLTLTCYLLEYALVLATWGLMVMVANEQYHSGLGGFFMTIGQLFEMFSAAGDDLGMRMLVVGLPWFLAIAILEPLYVAGGFALYINRRTHLEGWDIELAFRRLARRLQADTLQRAVSGRLARVGVLLLLCGGAAWAQDANQPPPPVESDDSPKDTIDAVLGEEAFGKQATRTRKRLPENSFGDCNFGDCQPGDCGGPNGGCGTCGSGGAGGGGVGAVGSGIGGLFQAMVWTVVVLAIVAFLVFLVRNWAQSSSGKLKDRAPPPEVIAGLDVRPESLPPDVPLEAASLWKAGDPVACLSLLYRGALAKLIHSYDLGLDESATEGDCVAAVRDARGPVDYFSRLTFGWQCVAYAERPPTDDEARALWEGWRRTFGRDAGGQA